MVVSTGAFRPTGVDPYEALGLKRGDKLDAAALKKAYRKAALQWHPDKVSKESRAEAEKKFIEIAWAYEVLSDPGKRAEFESGGQQQHGQGPGAGTAERDFSMKEAAKVFEDVFGTGSPEYNDLIQHLATASGHGDRKHWRKHAADIKKAMKNGKGDFTVETKAKDGSGSIKTSQTVTNDKRRGTTTKKTVTQHTHTSTSAGKPQALHGADPHQAHLDAHHRAHEAAVRAAQEAHARALGGGGHQSIGHSEF